MKTFALTTLIAVSLLVAGCHDSRDEAANPLRESDFYKTIGEQIPFETGMEWMSLYKKQESSLGRLESLPDFHVPAGKLNEMLESVDDLTGVAFHYGPDSTTVSLSQITRRS